MTERQEFIFTCKDEDELKYYKDKAMKLKVILLDNWEKHPLQNPKLLDKRRRERFEKELKELWNTMSDEQIDKEFGDICCSRLFGEGADVSNYPCFEPAGTPNHSILYDPAGNLVEVDTNK